VIFSHGTNDQKGDHGRAEAALSRSMAAISSSASIRRSQGVELLAQKTARALLDRWLLRCKALLDRQREGKRPSKACRAESGGSYRERYLARCPVRACPGKRNGRPSYEVIPAARAPAFRLDWAVRRLGDGYDIAQPDPSQRGDVWPEPKPP
jgi:hypothetical protein